MNASADREGLNERQESILGFVRQQGFVSVDALAEHFGVTTQTIRRDVNALCRQGRLRRFHGGAGLPSTVENEAYTQRQVQCFAEKQRIAAAVAGMSALSNRNAAARPRPGV